MLFLRYFFVFIILACLRISAQEEAPNDSPHKKDVDSHFFGFQASPKQPYHLSIGAVLFDDDGRIACHHFSEIFGHKDIYILMRESMEKDETPLMTLHRGLKEEFGATGQPIAFLGCLSGYLPDPRFSFDKTTLYIVCRATHFDSNDRDMDDPEACSVIEWLEPELLISLMEIQGVKFHHRADADESEMIRRALPYINNSSL